MILFLCVAAVAVAAYVLFAEPTTEPVDVTDGYLYEADDSVTASDSLDGVPAMDSTQTNEQTQDDTQTEQTEQTEQTQETSEASETTSEPEEDSIQTTQTMNFTAPLDGEVSHAYSGNTLEYNESTADWRTHNGTDYAGETGQAVYAVTDGTVTAIGNDSVRGQYVVLSHAQDVISIYAGLDEVTVSEGDNVQGGTQIASLGEPMPLEAAQGVHLHLELTKDGARIDPEELF